MFNRPIKIELDADNVTVDHKISVSPENAIQAERLIKLAGKTIITVIAVGAFSSSASEIVTHIAKTKI